MSHERVCVLACGTFFVLNTIAFGVTVTVSELSLLPANEAVNVLEVTLDGGFFIGSDTENSELSGSTSVELELDMSNGDPLLTGFSFTDGKIAMSDVSFSLAAGSISASSSGLGGTPSTPLPPGQVFNDQIDAADHQFTIDQGTITAVGAVTDFALEPFPAAGFGMGLVTLAEILPAMGSTRHFAITVDLPVAAAEVLSIDTVLGSIDIDINIVGNIVSQRDFELEIPNGDFNLDGLASCEDLAILYQRVAEGSEHATFDVDTDGLVSITDVAAWLDNHGIVAGDADLDGVVGAADFAIWRNHQFTSSTGWCDGDFSLDGTVDATDFNLWNDHRTQLTTASVPEPGTVPLLVFAALVFRWRRT